MAEGCVSVSLMVFPKRDWTSLIGSVKYGLICPKAESQAAQRELQGIANAAVIANPAAYYTMRVRPHWWPYPEVTPHGQ